MIKSLKLTNIQSHKDTQLIFSEGINAIIGSSNNGKTAILRGLNWIRYNRPLGVDTLASHWIVNHKGNLTNEMSVTITNELGSITRKRTKTNNQYIVDNHVLNVVKSDVPKEVENKLCLSETNIQNQQDSPFLLSQTSGEVAKYFNRIVRLDVIDRVLTRAETTRRKVNQEIEHTEETIKNLEYKLNEFDWLETVGELLDKIERVSIRNKNIHDKLETLQSSICEYNELVLKQKNYNFKDCKIIISKIEQEQEKFFNIDDNVSILSHSIKELKSIKIYPVFIKEKKYVEKILNYKPNTKEFEMLNNSILVYKREKNLIINNKKLIELNKLQLPNICPLCGNVLCKDKE